MILGTLALLQFFSLQVELRGLEDFTCLQMRRFGLPFYPSRLEFTEFGVLSRTSLIPKITLN